MREPDKVSLPDLLSLCLRGLERAVTDRNVRVVRQIDPTTSPILTERPLLKEILDSLLLEAGLSTPPGGRVRVCLKHSDAAVMVSVKDGGPGLSPSERDTLLSEAGPRARPGQPLSPAECLKGMRSLGGNLFVNSEAGKGSTYYVTFPASRPSREPERPSGGD